MKAIIPVLDENSKKPLYLQLYEYIKKEILSGEIQAEEKLPSLRNLSENLNISITTTQLAYSQLSVEGYIYSRPQSGYYVRNISYMKMDGLEEPKNTYESNELEKIYRREEKTGYKYDVSCFDFNKWKKCMNKVLNEYQPLLMFESEPQGEEALRYEISKYVYSSRGVICEPQQVVIGAGTQQITSQLCLILSKMGINHAAVEEPGYLPVKNMFRDRGFAMSSVAVNQDGIDIKRLPANIRSCVYVSPSNQFPTGAVMPVGKRYELLEWAAENNSIIIEDDYDSELRYFGKPVPSLQGLERKDNVVYLGSFSSTLFPSIKISYMVLPEKMVKLYREISHGYTQTCSKTEQLTLALFMEKGLYQTHIKKLRSLYSQKLQKVVGALNRYGRDMIRTKNTSSGINMIINVRSGKSAEQLCSEAEALGIMITPVAFYAGKAKNENSTDLVFYYNQIPIEDIDGVVKNLLAVWNRDKRKES
ncbi:MAG: PLP-dependent aminotransferase family protein [Anaerovoracaceae bacterium]